MDSKSQLNLYCQKEKKTTASYCSYKTNDIDHLPTFKGKCIFEGKEYETLETYSTKKEADKYVAKLVLSTVVGAEKTQDSQAIPQKKTQENPQVDPQSTIDNCYFFIDLDNQNNMTKIVEKLQSCGENCRFIGVGGPRMVIPTGLDNRFHFRRTESVAKDAADIELAFTLGEIIRDIDKNYKMLIFSTDYALSTLKTILTNSGYQSEFHCNLLEFL